jgi:hypothetical protein
MEVDFCPILYLVTQLLLCAVHVFISRQSYWLNGQLIHYDGDYLSRNWHSELLNEIVVRERTLGCHASLAYRSEAPCTMAARHQEYHSNLMKPKLYYLLHGYCKKGVVILNTNK